MKAKKTLKRLASMIAAFAFAVSLCAPTIIMASAEDTVRAENFAAISVTEDLADIDLSVYPKNEKGLPQVIRCQEFCYSDNDAVSEYYGLYVYVYNPTGKLLMNECSVNMAVAYDTATGEPTSYENVALDICNYSEDKLFYKFKVKDADKLFNVAKGFAEHNHDARRYDVAGIQLIHNDAMRLTDNDVSKTYRFEGFAAGCGEDPAAESTLTCTVGGLETIHLSINHTSYIHETPSDEANYIYDQVHTAYFSIPEEYFEQCGELQKIEAEWNEYKTAPVFVTWDLEAYEALMPYLGTWIGDACNNLDWGVFWEQKNTTPIKRFDAVFNKTGTGLLTMTSIGTVSWMEASHLPRMSLLFHRDKDDKYVSSNDLIKEMKRGRFESNHLINGKYPFEYFSNLGFVSQDDWIGADTLLMNKIDEERIPYLDNPSWGYGYVRRDIDADDVGIIKFADPDQSKWDEFWNGVDYKTSKFSPIETLTKDDVANVKSNNFGEKYFVNEQEEDIVYEYCKKETNAGNRAVLFRFAKTDYYASAARFDKNSGGLSSVDGYVAQQTVFLDFDILSLTFRVEDRKDVVFAVVANPVDIVPSIDASDDVFEQGTNIFDGLDWSNPFDELDEAGEKLKTALWIIGGTVLVAGIVALIVWIVKINGKKE